ncbi:hypothetical protein EV127DRAFT_426402 [Xylaria flabelliformis]|nr:hypothetical protein EV127DRAFT_426402 [Xylaria flabelliformis]
MQQADDKGVACFGFGLFSWIFFFSWASSGIEGKARQHGRVFTIHTTTTSSHHITFSGTRRKKISLCNYWEPWKRIESNLLGSFDTSFPSFLPYHLSVLSVCLFLISRFLTLLR